MGQGARTIFAQIAAQELGAPLDWVTVVMGDTAVVPYDQQTSASRSSVLMGNAVLLACRDIQAKLRSMAARLEGVDEASVVVDLRILGVAKDLPLAPMKGLYNVIWLGFWIQLASGTLLLIAYPTKALTNPDFYLKLTLIGLAVAFMQMLKNRVFNDSSLSESVMMLKGRALATWSLVFWTGAVTAGRLLAYTYNYLKYDYRG